MRDDELVAEVARLRAALEARPSHICSACGDAVEEPAAFFEHMRTCETHPLRHLRETLARLVEAAGNVPTSREDRNRCTVVCAGCAVPVDEVCVAGCWASELHRAWVLGEEALRA